MGEAFSSYDRKMEETTNESKVHPIDESTEKNSFDQKLDEKLDESPLSFMTRDFIENNPGPFEELHKDIKETIPQPFDGLKIVSNIPLCEFLQTCLTWNFSSDSGSTFQPGLNFLTKFPLSKSEVCLFGSVEYDGKKTFGVSLMNALTSNIRLKFVCSGNSKGFENFECSGLYLGKTYSANLSILEPSLKTKSCLVVGQFLKRFTNSIDAGVEVVGQLGVGGRQMFMPTLVTRFRHGSFINGKKSSYSIGNFGTIEPKGIFLSSVNLRALHFSYIRNIVPGFKMLTTYDFTTQGQFPHVASVGYSYSLSKHHITAKSSYDTTNTLQTVIEKSFPDGDSGWSFFVSVAHNFTADRTLTGVGLTIGR